jgi:hypothetical protein
MRFIGFTLSLLETGGWLQQIGQTMLSGPTALTFNAQRSTTAAVEC